MKTAVELFSSVPKLHNCAQAVSEGLGFPELLTEMAACGGGRAPGGRCGALHAAMTVVPADQREHVRQAFLAEMPSELCRELKANGIPCLKCVETAERLAKAALEK